MMIDYSAFVAICRVDKPENFGGFNVKTDGLYTIVPDDDAPLSPTERAVLSWHPTGIHKNPALPLPCTLEELRSFVADAGLLGCIDEDAITAMLSEAGDTAKSKAAYDETGLNGKAIAWHYWVRQMPVLDAMQAACLMSALEPDIFANLNGRPGKTDPAKSIEKARKIQRLAEAQGKLTASPAEWVEWAQAQSPRLNVHTGFLLAVWELPEATGESSDAAGKGEAGAGTSPSGNTIGNLAVFRAMSKLTADELSIAFVGDKPEPNSDVGANNFLEISARDATRSVALAALGLVKTQGVGLNNQGAMLLDFARNLEPPGNEATAQIISRLRRWFFEGHFGVKHDPFDPKAAKWKPRFKITDKRGAADERAKREAERHTVSLEQMNERGERVGDINDYPYEDEDDAAGELLRN